MVKHVKMSSFLDVGISNITNLGGNRISCIKKVCYVRNAEVEKTRYFNMFYHAIST